MAPRLGLFSATALVVASMIGAGVFTTTGFLLADLKSRWIVLAAWLVGGAIAALGAVCYGALARRIPESGGEYLFLSRTLHPSAGQLAGWVSLLVGFSAPLAAAALAFAEYAKPWLPDLRAEAVGTLLIAAFTIAHACGARTGAGLQNAAVAIKLAFLAAFLVLGLERLPSPPPEPLQTANAGDFAVALVWISFSYSGWNAAIYIAGDVRDPERNVPRAMLLGTLIVSAIYLALNALFLFVAPSAALAGKLEVARIAAEHLGGPSWTAAISAIVALALLTSVSSLIMSGPRVYARMAEDRCLPQWLRANGAVPRAAILFQSACAALLLWTASFKALLTCIGFTLGLSTAATVLGLVRLRLREGPRLRVPGWPVVPALFISFVVFSTTFTVLRQPRESLLGGLALATGWVAWKITEQRNRSSSRT